MADPEHLQQLRQGPATWNQWRQAYPTVAPTLAEAPLEGQELSGADLRWAQLRRADLRRALLRGTDLRWADLYEANLRQARLRKAELSGAHLGEADLSGAKMRQARLEETHLGRADLSGADLHQACLRGAHLCGAHLLKARLSQTDLRGADLRQADLHLACLREANLRQADLYEANFLWANLSNADLREANCRRVILQHANLSMADLRGADLREADLRGANLREADLRGANLTQAQLVDANLEGANLSGCTIYGISAWGTRLQGANQLDLCITPEQEPPITVDTLDVARFVSLQLRSTSLREAIEMVGKRMVLILGQFADAQQPILEAIRSALRACRFVPVWYAVQPPWSPESLDRVNALAQMMRFVFVDMTGASATFAEVPALVQHLTVPVQLFLPSDLGHDPSPLLPLRYTYEILLEPYWYTGPDDIQTSLFPKVLTPAEARAQALLAGRLL